MTDAVIATHAGLRGRPGQGLDEVAVFQAVSGLIELLQRRSLPATLGLAHDGRSSGGQLARQVAVVATGFGADVVDFGVEATPTVKLASARRELGGAIVVTGSHLGPEWNGLKLVSGPDYWPVDLRRLPRASERRRRRGRVFTEVSAAPEHAAAVCAAVDADAVRRSGFRVRVRGGTGRAAALALERLGCRSAEDRMDLNLVMDADADRLSLADESGRPFDPELTFALTALYASPRRIVKGADTSRMIDELAGAWGASVHTVEPGELHLLQGVRDHAGDLAGEGNGGVVVPNVMMARDGVAAAVLVLALLAREREPLSALAARLPRLARRRSTVPCPSADDASLILEALARSTGHRTPRPEEGLSLEAHGSGWALIRHSATEPVLRITVETRDEEQAEALHAALRAKVLEARSFVRA